MIDLPEAKELLIFEDRFLESIKQDEKGTTIRNSPVSLGYKSVDKGLIVEVTSCEKVYTHCAVRDEILWLTKPKEKTSYQLYFKYLGFENRVEMFDYYKKYLKSNFAYVILFQTVKLKG